jgi:hypothetical protein
MLVFSAKGVSFVFCGFLLFFSKFVSPKYLGLLAWRAKSVSVGWRARLTLLPSQRQWLRSPKVRVVVHSHTLDWYGKKITKLLNY